MREIPISKVWELRYPWPVSFAVTRHTDGRPNIITLGWSMPTSKEPMMVAISVAHSRFSYESLLSSGEFVLVWPPAEWAEAALLCGTRSGRDDTPAACDAEAGKFAAAGLEPLPATKVRPPLIEGAVACLECVVRAICPTGDHSIFVGEVVAAHAGGGEGRLYALDGSRRMGAFAADAPRET